MDILCHKQPVRFGSACTSMKSYKHPHCELQLPLKMDYLVFVFCFYHHFQNISPVLSLCNRGYRSPREDTEVPEQTDYFSHSFLLFPSHVLSCDSSQTAPLSHWGSTKQVQVPLTRYSWMHMLGGIPWSLFHYVFTCVLWSWFSTVLICGVLQALELSSCSDNNNAVNPSLS